MYILNSNNDKTWLTFKFYLKIAMLQLWLKAKEISTPEANAIEAPKEQQKVAKNVNKGRV